MGYLRIHSLRPDILHLCRSAFWSHTYTDWEQIESPSPIGETGIHGLTLDWKRFCSAQTRSFLENEIAPLKAENPLIPVTTNFMLFYYGISYHELAKSLDIVSWDSYPAWHSSNDGDESEQACLADAYSDLCRSMLGKPFLVFVAIVAAYFFASLAMLIPAIDEFDVATGRSTAD